MSGKSLHAILVIALIYVCALNVLIVHNLYERYGRRVLALPGSTAARSPSIRAPLNRTAPQNPLPAQGCAVQQRAVVVLCASVTGTNDVNAHVPLFAQLRLAFRVAESPPPLLFVAVSADDFLPFHRSWCSSLYSQSRQKVSCTLLLQQQRPALHDVLRAALGHSPCIADVVSLPDDVTLGTHWLAAVGRLPRHKVVCLADMDTASGVCDTPAYFLPGRFVAEFTAVDHPVSVENSARQWKMFHGNRRLIHKNI